MERRGGKGKGANGGECEGTEGEERKGRLSLSVLLAPGSYGRLTDAAVAVRRTKRHRKYYIKAPYGDILAVGLLLVNNITFLIVAVFLG